jgi:hypothetical protein
MKKRIDLDDIGFKFVCAFVFVVIGLIAVFIVVGVVKNENNHISTGTVVNKDYQAPCSYGNTKDGFRYDPARYSLTIAGEKNGEYVEYTFDCPEAEYMMYNIGDKYPRENQ